MSYPLGPLSSADVYNEVNRVETQECARLDVFVSSNPIYYQLYQGGNWTSEKYIPSATGQTYFVSLDRIFSGFRFKSAVLGQSAVVVAELIPAGEIPQ